VIQFSLENVLNYYSKVQLPAKEKIEKIYFSGSLNFKTMSFCYKILDILDTRVKRYRVKMNLELNYPENEVFYRRYDRINIDEGKFYINIVKLGINKMIELFIELLISIDSVKYKLLRQLYINNSIFKL
jgi:hypothetical protein